MGILSEVRERIDQEPAELLTAVGLGTVFIVFGAWELSNPVYWQGYVPEILASFQPLLLVKAHGLVMLLAGIGINMPRARREFSIVSVLLMLEIVASLSIESGFSDILVRDIGLLFMALAAMTKAFSTSSG
ncbi:MAG: hypothetical protein ABEJ95_01660 [Candidatus Nanohalobium sp.]